MKFHLLIKPQMPKNSFLAFKFSDVFIMLRNIKMSTIVNIFEHDKFMINSCSVVEHENAQLLSMRKNNRACSHFWASYDHQYSANYCPADLIDYLYISAHVVLNLLNSWAIEKICKALSGFYHFRNKFHNFVIACTVRFRSKTRFRGFKPFSCSPHLSMKFILLINVKMPTNVGILTIISRINTTW